MNSPLNVGDLFEITHHKNLNFELMKKTNVLISGASGFVGTWLTSSLLFASDQLNWDIQITAIVRNPEKLLKRLPKRYTNLKTLELDYTKGAELELDPHFTHIVQSTTPSMPNSGSLNEQLVSQVSLNSNKLLIEFATQHKNPPVFCHLSSGAVYGNPSEFEGPVEEKVPQLDFGHLSSYAKTKLIMEREVEEASTKGYILGCNPRLFTFGGPFLELNAQFAIGNFMGNVIRKEPISVMGNPATIRSYLYPTDLVANIIALLGKPTINATNIGSNLKINIFDLATTFSRIFDLPLEISSDSDSGFSSYYPSTTKSETWLGIKQQVFLEDALLRWRYWLST